MPEAVSSTAPRGWLRHAAIGFHGKIPARGDFVRAGLPRAFTDPWDGWMQQMLAASRSVLGEAWLPAWLEAAIWRFALTPGICGPDAVIGVWMPSVDRVGRYYPLSLAAVTPNADSPTLVRYGGGFLAAAEWAGRDAVENELTPDELFVRLAAAIAAPTSGSGADPASCPPEGGLWWTDGAPRVSAGVFTTVGLPDEDTFSSMLVSCSPALRALFPE
jgi:type VI secretion system protein ImpM